jgi:bla regulator protein blaR1
MSADTLLHALVEISAASSAAILIVGALRKPIRRIAGARVAYWLWFSVPAASIALWLPAPSRTSNAFTHALASSLAAVAYPMPSSMAAAGGASEYTVAAVAVWLSGALCMAMLLVYRQKAFIRSLGCLTAGMDGVFRSDCVAAPMIVGAWRAQVVVPADFEARYPEEDRVLMLAHERAHLKRGDPIVNSVATVSLCLLWFNPLFHWGVGRFRFDQELACDAIVLARSESSKKRYADALLKAQVVSESVRCVPIGCHWRSGHPLKERINMLKLTSPGVSRRLFGIAFNVVLTASCMYGVSMCFAKTPGASASVANHTTNCVQSTDKKFSIDAKNADTRTVLAMIARKSNHNILVGDEVRGRITIHLSNVTWRQALNVVAESQGLTTRQSDDLTVVGVSH